MKDLLLNYVKYNFWANTRIADKLKTLSPADWDKEQKSSFKTIRLTLLHIYGAETIWYQRLNGNSLSKFPGVEFTGTNEEATGLLLEASKNFIHFLNSQSGETLKSLCDFKSLEGKAYSTPVSDIILHCMNHSTFHRGQLITMLRNCGADELPSTDYITYIRLNTI
jgi:uncharacterized damage-inducible protein DinB